MKFIWNDYLIALGALLNLGARFITFAVVNKLSNYVANAQILESNPNRNVILFQNYSSIIATAIAYALLLAYYIYLRRKKDKDESWQFAFTTYTTILFVMALFDFINDLSIFVGVFLLSH